MNNLMQDLRYAVRMLAKAPAFTVVAVLTLALGIGANTAVFSYVNSLFLRPLPFAKPEQLLRVYRTNEDRKFGTFSYATYLDLRDQNNAFASLAAHQYAIAALGERDAARNVDAEVVSGNYFSTLGVNAALGRMLGPGDDLTAGAHPVVVISDRLWKREFGGAADAIGKSLRLNNYTFIVIGVAPPFFRGSFQSYAADVWAPMAMHEQIRPRGIPLTSRNWDWLFATGRLKSGVAPAQAQQEIARLAGHLRSQKLLDKENSFTLAQAGPLPDDMRAGSSKIVLFAGVIVGLLLAVACANISSALLSCMVARRRETGIRISLGATRGRLIRQWLTESVLLSGMGAAAGILLALWLAEGFLRLRPADFAVFSPEIALDTRVLFFAALIALLTGVLFGLFPALRATRVDPISSLKEESGSAGGHHRSRLFGAFVVAQVALSILALVPAGLLARTLRAAREFDPGFDSRNLVLAHMNVRRHGYDEARGSEFYRRLAERVRMLPGVEQSTVANVVPLGFAEESRGFRIPGHQPPEGRSTFSIATNLVGADYFRTMKIPILLGRDFGEREMQPGSAPAIVINETMAQRFWPGQNPVGQIIQFGATGPQMEIIGVARNHKYYSLGEPPRSYVYASSAQIYSPDMTVHIRTSADAAAIVRAAKAEVAALDPNVIVQSITFDELRAMPLAPQRAMAVVAGTFGLLAMLLTAVGIYGMFSYAVSQRTQEIGVRMALGARPADIQRMVLGKGAVLLTIGVALGCGAALGATQLMKAVLFGVSAADPLTFSSVSLLLVAVALLACYVPARRASRVDPMVALRYE